MDHSLQFSILEFYQRFVELLDQTGQVAVILLSEDHDDGLTAVDSRVAEGFVGSARTRLVALRSAVRAHGIAYLWAAFDVFGLHDSDERHHEQDET